MSRRKPWAELRPDETTIACSRSSCGTTLGRRFFDVERREHFLYLDEYWIHERTEGVWREMARAAAARREGRRATRRDMEGYDGPLGHIPYNLPIRLKCPNPNCGTEQVADPARLRVSANAAPRPEDEYEGPVSFMIPPENVANALRHSAQAE